MITFADGPPGVQLPSYSFAFPVLVGGKTTTPRSARVPRALVRVAVLLLGSLLPACSGGDDDASGPETGSQLQASAAVDVCSLLLPSDIAAATGLSWADGAFDEAQSAADRFVCNWYNAGGDYALVQVMIVANSAAFSESRAGAADVFGLAQGGVSINRADDAFATSEGSLIGMAVGDVFVQVSYVPPGPGEVLEATRRLAQAVAERLWQLGEIAVRDLFSNAIRKV